MATSTTRSSSSPGGGHGAYGFCLEGVPEASALLVPAAAGWPRLELVRYLDGSPAAGEDRVDESTAQLTLVSGGAVRLDRRRGRAAFHLPRRPADHELVHPYLAPAALVAAHWLGRESFHAGAIVLDGGAWAVLGEKGAGKSSTLGWLAASGHTVLTDDVLVLDGPAALPGPRCVDLREEAAARLGAGEPIGRVGMRERWRLPLAGAPAAVPLRGWVSLAWGAEVAVTPVRGAERLRALARHRGVRLAPTDPAVLVELSALPHWELRRPQRWDAMEAGVTRLLAALAG
jgi:hypothetical protein